MVQTFFKKYWPKEKLLIKSYNNFTSILICQKFNKFLAIFFNMKLTKLHKTYLALLKLKFYTLLISLNIIMAFLPLLWHLCL